MKKTYFILALLLSVSGVAQIPAGYYNAATGSGYTLKTQLYNIIKDHDAEPYSNIDNFFPIADRDLYYENDNTILDPYSERPNATDPYNYSVSDPGDQCGNYDSEGDCYNAEHVIPQSVFSQNEPMRGDAHHLLPTDGRVNGFRSNHPFGVVGTLISQSGITNPTMNGSKLGNNLNSGYSAGYTGIVFEPIDEFKGDIARIYFYFATRYQNVVSGWPYAMFDGSSTKVIADPFLQILLTWHANDPVSAKEVARNNAVYNYQGNRNPFIDHPEYACIIWSATCSLAVGDFEVSDIQVYPVPSNNGRINISTSNTIENIQLVNINGQIIRNIENPERNSDIYIIDQLQPGFYFLRLSAGSQTQIRKIIIN
ncbi:MAG TPA: endonuclease [Flavobacterium sp.]|jgi:endonuclease I